MIDLICDNCGRKYKTEKPDDMPEDAIAMGLTDCENCEEIDPFMDDSFPFWIYDEERLAECGNSLEQ